MEEVTRGRTEAAEVALAAAGMRVLGVACKRRHHECVWMDNSFLGWSRTFKE